MKELLFKFAAILDDQPFPKASNAEFRDIFNIAYAIFGVIAVLVVVYASIQLIISQGNSEKVATARRNVIYAIVGLIVIILSGAIVNFFIVRLAS